MVTIQDCYSLIQTIWSMKLKLKIFMKILVNVEKSLIFKIIHTYFDNSNQLVVGKMKDWKAIKKFVGLTTKKVFILGRLWEWA